MNKIKKKIVIDFEITNVLSDLMMLSVSASLS